MVPVEGGDDDKVDALMLDFTETPAETAAKSEPDFVEVAQSDDEKSEKEKPEKVKADTKKPDTEKPKKEKPVIKEKKHRGQKAKTDDGDAEAD